MRYYIDIYAIIYSAISNTCAIIYMQVPSYICTAKTATCFMPRYYPKPTGYVHVAVCCIGRYKDSIKAILRMCIPVIFHESADERHMKMY